ncbi:MAG: DUF2071 domain-containing protein [Acidimicrobiales bacterium]
MRRIPTTHLTIPALRGSIERRFLINYRADPDVVRPHLPTGFEAHLVDGACVVGICLIELRVRPTGLPASMGLRSFNGAHRYAVVDPGGRPSVYIPRRDTNSTLGALVGGRLFPGSQSRARIDAAEVNGGRTRVTLDSADGRVHVAVSGRPVGRLPAGSVFGGVVEASSFFEDADTGYSDTGRVDCLDAVTLRTTDWSVTPFEVDEATSSFFDDPDRFPPGSIALDHGLFMHDIDHAWQPLPRLALGSTTTG